MTFTVDKGLLAVRGTPSRTDLARVTIQLRTGSHEIIVHWAGLRQGKRLQLSPVEVTLPEQDQSDIEHLRELQRGVLRHSLDRAFSDDRATRAKARELIEFYARELRSPLACTPVRLNNLFAVWEPRHPDGNDAAIEIGKVIDIDVT